MPFFLLSQNETFNNKMQYNGLGIVLSYVYLSSRSNLKKERKVAGNLNNPLDQALTKIKSQFNLKNSTLLILMVIVVVAIWILITGLYTVDPEENAVIQRFGKYNRTEGPGLNFKWPDGIEKRTNVPIQSVFTEEFGLQTLKAGVRTKYAPEDRFQDESLMLTGDLNCALVPWIVQFRISDPVKFLFKVRSPQKTLRDLSEAMMRQVVGDRSINEVITGRLEIADLVKVELQKALDDAETGMMVINVELKNTNVPGPVQPSFNEVNEAQQEKEKMIYQARENFNKIIPAAKGEADEVISNAEAYALDRINKAKGDSSRFVSLYNEYSSSKNATRRRMYLETMQELLPKLGNKYIVDSDQKNLLPLLNMESIGGKK